MAWLLDLMRGGTAVAVDSRDGKSGFTPPAVFKDGTRNDYLYRTARSLKAKYNLGAEEILNALQGINEKRCQPPMGLSELQQIAHNAATQANSPGFEQKVDPDVERLSRLSPLEYDKIRKTEAKRLGVSVKVLDAEVLKVRPKEKPALSEPLAPPAPEPWPDPVNGESLLGALKSFLNRFIFADPNALIAATLWIVFTYLLDVAETSPRLAITSPTKRCGKTLFLSLLSALVYRPIGSSNLSPASVFRVIDAERCSLLLDEADAMPRKSERGEEMRGLLNSGHTRATAYAIRNVKIGDDWVPKKFSTWAAIAIAAIGNLPDTWADRSIRADLKRKPAALRKEKFNRRNREAQEQAVALARQIARWTNDQRAKLAAAMPEIPEELDDRAADNWEMLLAIADLAGGRWLPLARGAALGISASRIEGVSLSEQLIHDIREIFEREGCDKISSADLCKALAAMEQRPWSEYGRSEKPITPAKLARQLARFGITPGTIRLGETTAKGYALAAFEEAFSSYPPISPISNRHNVTTLGAVRENGDFQNVTEESCDVSENRTSSHGEKECDVVTFQNHLNGDEEEKSAEDDGWVKV